MPFPVPESMMEYYGNKAVFNAVNELTKALGGKRSPYSSREEASNYNQALLMAAQVRADFVDLLFRVWDEIFGEAKITGEECFDSQGYTVSEIWMYSYLGVSYYYGKEESDLRSNTLGVIQEDDEKHTISLFVERFSRTEKLARRPARSPKGWKIVHGEEGWYFGNDPVDMVEFLEDPEPSLERFRRDAIKMVKFLAKTPV